jgi:hypothetical protein
MRVFIAESGAASGIVAQQLKAVLPLIVQGLDPYLASLDMPKGVAWASELMAEIDRCDFGLFCVTSESLRSAWFNFEAGATLKSPRNQEGRVFAYLVGGSLPSRSPLTLFQFTRANYEDTYALFSQFNEANSRRVSTDHFKRLFDTFWPDLRTAVSAARRLSRPDGDGNGRS